MGKLFGTDGLRGVAGEYPLDAATTELLGRILYFQIVEKGIEPEIIVGRDTRESGPVLVAALSRGFTAAGGTLDDAGIISTPALAFLARREKKCSVAITASHNPYQDNGIKIFGPDGYKLSDETEGVIEPYLLGEKIFHQPGAPTPGTIATDKQEHFRHAYCSYLVDELFSDLDLTGMKIALDCANGALFEIAPHVLRRLGAQLVALNTEPNGKNINDHCGSLYPNVVFEKVQDNGYDCGFTFDGDGDRCLCADRDGMYDGDFILAAAGCFLQERGALKKNSVVATSMSNLGLEAFLKKRGIHLHRVPVGDKNVLEKLQQEGLSLGGEQSGHIIFMNDTFIGDGLLTALQMLRIYKHSGAPFQKLCDGFIKYPQILQNVPVKRKPELEVVPEIQEKIIQVEQLLGESGRIIVRYSGTEPVARIMIEGPEQAQIEQLAREVADVMKTHLS